VTRFFGALRDGDEEAVRNRVSCQPGFERFGTTGEFEFGPVREVELKAWRVCRWSTRSPRPWDERHRGVRRADRLGDRVLGGGARRRGGELEFVKAYGLAHRGWEIPNQVDTRFGIASGTKGLTALTVMSLVDEGLLSRTTTARSVLGEDLPLIDDAVTVEHLLAHRSGIGDYYDEEIVHDPLDYVSPVPVHELGSTEEYLRVLDGFETKFPPDERFSYSNGGYVVLALIAERAAGKPFHELVVQRVCEPAGMVDTEFLRSDELAGGAALGYLAEDGPRTNIFHLPGRGSGDGGISTTAPDVRALWTALFAGRIVSKDLVAEMVRPRSEVPSPTQPARYGLEIWLHPTSDLVELHGSDAGVSFQTVHDPSESFTYTVLSNTTEGAWPIVLHLDELFHW
jgi:CubicO group peptidase (beta-lactamase class C family)